MADTLILLASCFQYPNPANGDIVTSSTIPDYVSLIGKRCCALINQVNQNSTVIAQLASRLLAQEERVFAQYTLPSLFPKTIDNPNIALPLDTFTAKLELQFSDFRNAVGYIDNIAGGLALIENAKYLDALGTTGGKYSSLTGWKQTTNFLADGFINLALMVSDLRNAIRNIQANCCTGLCDGVEIVVQGTLINRVLTLYFTGAIPENLFNQEPGGSLLRLEDFSGAVQYQKVDIKTNMNSLSGVQIDLTATNFNFLDDIRISGVYSLNDPEKGSVCQRYIDKTITNNSSCPSVDLTQGFTDIAYSFIHAEGISVYTIQLYDAVGNLMQSQSRSMSATGNVTGQFLNLTESTTYKIRVLRDTSNSTKVCPFITISTMDALCLAANSLTVEITY